MTLMFNAVEFIHRLEKAGLAREAAEAIASGIEQRNSDLATKADIERLGQELDRRPTKSELEAAISTAMARQTMQFGAIIGGAAALIIAAVGVIVSIH